MEETQKKNRIGWGMIIGWFLLSGLADLCTLIPFVGTAVGPAYWVLFGFYLWKTGHGLVNWRRAVPGLLSIVGEFIPFVQALPTIWTATILIIILSRLEDKTGIAISQHFSKRNMRFPDRRRPLNKNGVRQPRKNNIV